MQSFNNLKGPKILLVDDDPINLMVLEKVVAHRNFDTTLANDGYDALKKSNETNYDLILLDVMMPGLDGYEVCKKLRQDPKTKDVPVIFLTAKSDSESIKEGFDSGGQDYITKPFNRNELLARVDTQLSLKAKSDSLWALNNELNKRVVEQSKQLKKAQDEIQRISYELNKKNIMIEDLLHDAQKSKISRNATILAILLTVTLIIVSEILIEPMINLGFIYIGLILKAFIVMLYKPFELIIEHLAGKLQSHKKTINKADVISA